MSTMSLPKGVLPFIPNDPWENGHQNFKHRFKPGASYDLRIDGVHSNLKDYNATTANIQWVISEAIKNGTSIRAMGNNWSFSEVAMCDGGVITTKGLNLWFRPGNSSLATEYKAGGKTKEDLLFVQCGTTICNLNEILEQRLEPRRCIVASGGSNGQTLAGATSTGTHGGALFTGAVHDSIVGLHIVTGPDTHVWLERASYPVASDEFVNALGATAIRDDAMFNAAVVSFGSFGIIHGLMIETEPLYLLEEYRFDHVPYTDGLVEAITTLNLPALRALLPGMPEDSDGLKLYHLEINLNLFDFEKNSAEKGLYVRTFYKKTCPPEYEPNHDPEEGARSYGDDLPGIISRVLDVLGPVADKHLIAPLVNTLFKTALRAAQPAPKTIGETFRYTRFRGQLASAALAVETKNVFKAVEVVLAVNREHPFAGGIALRFVKGTQATLGFTRFEHSCVLEMDGVDAPTTRAFFEKVWLRLEAQSIPYTLHWGKLNFVLNAERVRRMYGEDRVEGWLACRNALLDADARKVFTNGFMRKCGLDGSQQSTVPASSPVDGDANSIAV